MLTVCWVTPRSDSSTIVRVCTNNAPGPVVAHSIIRRIRWVPISETSEDSKRGRSMVPLAAVVQSNELARSTTKLHLKTRMGLSTTFTRQRSSKGRETVLALTTLFKKLKGSRKSISIGWEILNKIIMATTRQVAADSIGGKILLKSNIIITMGMVTHITIPLIHLLRTGMQSRRCIRSHLWMWWQG